MILDTHYETHCFSYKRWLSTRIIIVHNRYVESIRMQNPPEIPLSIELSASIGGSLWRQGPGRRFTTHQHPFPYSHVIVMGWEGLLIYEKNHSLETKLGEGLEKDLDLEFQKSQSIIERHFLELLLEGILKPPRLGLLII